METMYEYNEDKRYEDKRYEGPVKRQNICLSMYKEILQKEWPYFKKRAPLYTLYLSNFENKYNWGEIYYYFSLNGLEGTSIAYNIDIDILYTKLCLV
jgi:hypothetical protein